MAKRQHNRHPKRLEAVFASGGISHRGITSDISESGLFIRTRHALAPGSILDIEICLPDGKTSKIKGIVKRSLKIVISTPKNGMGIELIDKDSNYFVLLNSMGIEKGRTDSPAPKPETSEAQMLPEYLILSCSGCSAKNKVLKVKITLNPRCGKCGALLKTEGTA